MQSSKPRFQLLNEATHSSLVHRAVEKILTKEYYVHNATYIFLLLSPRGRLLNHLYYIALRCLRKKTPAKYFDTRGCHSRVTVGHAYGGLHA